MGHALKRSTPRGAACRRLLRLAKRVGQPLAFGGVLVNVGITGPSAAAPSASSDAAILLPRIDGDGAAFCKFVGVAHEVQQRVKRNEEAYKDAISD